MQVQGLGPEPEGLERSRHMPYSCPGHQVALPLASVFALNSALGSVWLFSSAQNKHLL